MSSALGLKEGEAVAVAVAVASGRNGGVVVKAGRGLGGEKGRTRCDR